MTEEVPPSGAEGGVSLKDQGNEFFKSGNYLKAAALYTQAIKQDPSNPTLYSNRSAAFLHLVKLSRSLADAETTITLKPQWEKGYFRKGCVLEAMERYDDAVAAFQAALQYNPQNAEVSRKIKRLTQLARDKKRAQEVETMRSNIDIRKHLDPMKPELTKQYGSEESCHDIFDFIVDVMETAIRMWHESGKVDARVNFLLDKQKTDTEKHAPIVNIDKAFESPHTHSNCLSFLRQYAVDSFSRAALLVTPKSSITYPQVWKGQGSRKWKHGQSDGFFVQLESPLLRKLWFVPSSSEKGRTLCKYRIQSDRKVAVCSIHPSEQATLQCVGCVKAKIPAAKSYHCSPRCFSDAWQHHRALHERATTAVNENGTEEEEKELFGRLSSSGSGVNAGLSGPTSNVGQSLSLNIGSAPLYPAVTAEWSGGETWFEVGRCKIYTPTAEDIGHVLKFECVAVDSETRTPLGPSNTLMTSRVIPAPCPIPRRLISVNGVDLTRHLDSDGRPASSGTFTVLSYNILADVYATSESYSYCPSWALSWPYRRQNLLREIVGYHADILCFQEVQSDHFEEFFAPELDKHGYQALYKKKTSEVYSGNASPVDGCATFFRRDRFAHVKKYEVEFNKAAQSLTEAVLPSVQKKTALSRLLQDNVALIAVLEAKFSNHGADNPGKRQLLCVANTHVNIQHDLKDVRLWQVHTLVKGLEKIAVSADIPMLVCGDFNSVPGSAAHSLLAMGKVDPLHPDLAIDPFGILRPPSKLNHQLPLISAYSSFARMVGVGINADQQRRRMDPTTNEPLFTNCTRDFIGTVDYIFYTADTLMVDSLLELLDEESLRKDTALPSPEWSSDHIALLAEFRCKPRTRR